MTRPSAFAGEGVTQMLLFPKRHLSPSAAQYGDYFLYNLTTAGDGGLPYPFPAAAADAPVVCVEQRVGGVTVQLDVDGASGDANFYHRLVYQGDGSTPSPALDLACRPSAGGVTSSAQALCFLVGFGCVARAPHTQTTYTRARVKEFARIFYHVHLSCWWWCTDE